MISGGQVLSELARGVHALNERWWTNLKTGERYDRNVGELLMLVVSELAEALEGDRKGLMDDKLPHRRMIEVELADAVIRILDMAGGLGLDIGGAFDEKLAYNATRHDHTKEGRLAAGGKKY
jgi:NTP pyrophosphatase (non-canonical NTP hydrolase)